MHEEMHEEKKKVAVIDCNWVADAAATIHGLLAEADEVLAFLHDEQIVRVKKLDDDHVAMKRIVATAGGEWKIIKIGTGELP
jgi:hypothetical protein